MTDVPCEELFASQMQMLSEMCNVLSLEEAAGRLFEGSLPSRAACITFDDGYADNLAIAAPVLKGLGLPATFFITCGAIEKGIMWNDLVIEGVRRARGKLDLRESGLCCFYLADDSARRQAIRTIIDALKYQHCDNRWSAAKDVFARCTQEPPPRLMMSARDVAELAKMGFDIGSHTMRHPILSRLPAAEAHDEIEDSRDWVARVTGRTPKSFAYPNGRPGDDFSAEHEELVRAAGFTVAVSTRWAAATRRDSRFALPRFSPWEQDRWGFWQRLAKSSATSYLGS